MRVIVIGGHGVIGSQVLKLISVKVKEAVAIGRNTSPALDMSSPQSIEEFYEAIGAFDAMVLCAGTVPFKGIADMSPEDYMAGLENKLMGQVNLVKLGLNRINDRGSFTLTSGILNRDPIVNGSAAAMVNGALEGFVRSAAIEMPRGIRINCVSPTVVQEAWDKYQDFFAGFNSVPAEKVAKAYQKSIFGAQNGQIYTVFG